MIASSVVMGFTRSSLRQILYLARGHRHGDAGQASLLVSQDNLQGRALSKAYCPGPSLRIRLGTRPCHRTRTESSGRFARSRWPRHGVDLPGTPQPTHHAGPSAARRCARAFPSAYRDVLQGRVDCVLWWVVACQCARSAPQTLQTNQEGSGISPNPLVFIGTEGRNRTGMGSPPSDFESDASTSFATPAVARIIGPRRRGCQLGSVAWVSYTPIWSDGRGRSAPGGGAVGAASVATRPRSPVGRVRRARHELAF